MLVESAATQATGGNVTGAIRDAARATGTNFEYLLATARVESRLNPNAAAPTSSARGLYQFIEQTWLGTLKESGANLGYGRYADAITRLPSGRLSVSDPSLRREILDLRGDASANAKLAGAFTQHNAQRLEQRLGRAATNGELYIAHFLGAGGAGKLIARAANDPQASAAELFPNAARANRSIFFDRQGRERNVAEVYGTLVGRYDVAVRKALPGATDVAALGRSAAPAVPGPPVAQPIAASRIAAVNDAFPESAAPPSFARGQVEIRDDGAIVPAGSSAGRDVAKIDPRIEAQIVAAVPPPPTPVFHSMFRSDERAGPVSAIVRELWSTRPHVAAALTGVPVTASNAAAKSDRAPFDLFGARGARVRELFTGRS